MISILEQETTNLSPPIIGKLYITKRPILTWSTVPNKHTKLYINKTTNSDLVILFFNIEIRKNKISNLITGYLCNFIGNDGKFWQFRFLWDENLNDYLELL